MIATVFTNTKKGSKTIDTLNLVNVYLIEENKNALYNLYNYSAISFDPQNKYMLWAVTDKNELAVFTAKKFAKIPKNFSGTYNFEMKLSSKKMSSLRQVKSILDMKSLFNDI